jgi:hypothetical protein
MPAVELLIVVMCLGVPLFVGFVAGVLWEKYRVFKLITAKEPRDAD